MTTTVDAAIDDTPCRQCRYNLRGLGRDGLCPECGTPVAFSFDGGVLRRSDPAWVARLRVGATLTWRGPPPPSSPRARCSWRARS